MTITTTTFPATLESVVQQFEHWRATRGKRRKIPNELWALVAPLMNQYSRNEIATALRLNYAQMKTNVSPYFSHSQQESSTFVEYPSPLPISTNGSCMMEFTCKNGSTVKISGVTPAQLQPLFSILLGS